jgi:hypothetical protein
MPIAPTAHLLLSGGPFQGLATTSLLKQYFIQDQWYPTTRALSWTENLDSHKQ